MKSNNDLSEIRWKEIGTRISKRRTACGLTQDQLAEKINLSSNHLSGIENGTQHPSLTALVLISQQLNSTPDYFLLGNTRRHNVPQNVIDSLYLCNDSQIAIISSLIEAVMENEKIFK